MLGILEPLRLLACLGDAEAGHHEGGLEPGWSQSSSVMGWPFRSRRDGGVSTAFPSLVFPVFSSFRSSNAKRALAAAVDVWYSIEPIYQSTWYTARGGGGLTALVVVTGRAGAVSSNLLLSRA